MNNESKGMVLGFLGVAAFSLTLPATRHLTPYLDPLFISFGRVTLAAVIALAILSFSKNPFPDRKLIIPLALTSLGVAIGFPLFTSIAMVTIPASHGAVVLAGLPLATSIAGCLLTDERPSLLFWLISLAGGILVFTYMLSRGSGSMGVGDIALVLAVISVSFGYALGAKLAKQVPAWKIISWAVIFALPISIIPTVLFFPKNLESLPSSTILSFLYIGAISQLAAFFVWYRALWIGGIARVSQVQLLQPFLTIVFSYLLLNEQLSSSSLMFAAAVVVIVFAGKKAQIS